VQSHEMEAEAEQEKEELQEKLSRKLGIDKFFFFFLIWQAIILILYILFVDYQKLRTVTNENTGYKHQVAVFYDNYVWLSLMVFGGFGMTMSFPRKAMLSGIGFSFFAAAYAVEIGILANALFQYIGQTSFERITLTIPNLIDGVYVAGAVLISYGALVGRINTAQFLVMTTIEVAFYALNYWISFTRFELLDVGMSRIVHMYGGFFGFCASITFGWGRDVRGADVKNPSYVSNVISISGTAILWFLWPAWNSIFAPQSLQLIVVLNTVASLTFSVITAGFISHQVHGNHFSLNDMRLATVAGGVIMSSNISFITNIWLAIVLGFFAGFFSSFLNALFTRGVESRWGVKDTLGVFFTHGILGLLSAIAGFLATLTAENYADQKMFGIDYFEVFRGNLQNNVLYQISSILITFLLSIFPGLFAGLIMRKIPILQRDDPDFTDHREWKVPKDFPVHITRSKSKFIMGKKK